MKHQVIWLAVIALAAQTAQAGHLGFGGGGSGLGGHRGDFGGFDGGFSGGFLGGGLLAGYGGLDAERLQTRFETKFENLQSDYDDGLANVEDFYNSDDYTSVVDGVEHLSDRYDLFLTSVQHSIDRLGDVISIATDDLTYYGDLVEKYQARDDLSQARLDRIIERLTNLKDHLSDKIHLLTEKQTTLSDNLGSYQTFGSDLSTYLNEIVTAGGGTTDGSDTSSAALAAIDTRAIALRSLAEMPTTLGDEMTSCEQPSALAATAVPEPGAQCLVLAALSLFALWRPTRGRAVG